ncbi:MAG: GDSL-type esterase/lipase family protein [Chloroflexota bacterium]
MDKDALLLPADDPRLTWQGIISLEKTAGWIRPWRLPYADRTLFPPAELQERAAMAAGVRLSFYSDTTFLAGAVETDAETSRLDLCCNERLVGSQGLAGGNNFLFAGLPAGEKLLELWLPQYGQFRLRHLALSPGASVAPYVDDRPRWLTYGSSITQCRAAEGPTQTWPAVVARERGLNLTCLGYGGQCHLEPMIAQMMRDLPADFLSLCVGINVYGHDSLSARTFGPALIGFVQILRERHPNTPLAVISPIYCAARERTPNAVGLTLEAMREEIATVVAALRARGDRNIQYVDGLRLFGPDLVHLLPDGLHPNAEGYELLGRNFLREVVAEVFPPA